MESHRRSFLAGGAALVAAQLASAAPAGKKVRVGIAGGGFGTGFQFHEHPDCVVEAVTDLREDRRNKLMQVYRCSKSYESLEKMLFDKNLDAVFCATPAPDHLKHVTMTLRAGKLWGASHCQIREAPIRAIAISAVRSPGPRSRSPPIKTSSRWPQSMEPSP